MADETTLPTQQELFDHVLGDQPRTPPPDSPPSSASTEPAAVPPQPEPKAPEPQPPEAAIPSWRLREEAEARRQAEDRARQLQSRLEAIEAHLKQSQQPKGDFFANPDEAVQQQILRHMQPLAQETHRQMVALGKTIADAVHGEDVVTTAEQAFLEAMNDRTLDPADYERVVQAPNRYDAVVKWHRNHEVLASVGTDPNAWFERQLEERMNDPNFQAKLLEKVRGDAAKRPTAVNIPPSLSSVTAAKGNSEPVGDMSNDSLFAHAMRR